MVEDYYEPTTSTTMKMNNQSTTQFNKSVNDPTNFIGDIGNYGKTDEFDSLNLKHSFEMMKVMI